LPCGYLGVQAFFVLSGFLITPILIKMKDEEPSSYFSKFYGRRSIRIFPLYYLYLLFISLVLLITNAQGAAITNFFHQLPYAATYTYNFFHASSAYKHTPLITHFWSLAVEEQFYLFWPVLLFFTPKAYVRILLIVFMFLSPLFRYVCFNFINANNFPVYSEPATVVYVLSTSHIDAFATGGLFALLIKHIKAVYTWLCMGCLIIAGLLSHKLSVGYFYFKSFGYPPFMNDSYKYIWGYTCFNIVFAMILLNIKDNNFLPRLFRNGVLDYLGKISYGLYVYHYAIIYFVGKLQFNKPTSVFVSLLITIAISVASFELYEKRILVWKDKLFPIKHPNIQ
jgi:peptidoglycan/LPS O-acetylase OafA/YrhL